MEEEKEIRNATDLL